MPYQRHNYIYGIDLLRFFAALAVLLFHFRTFGAVEKTQYAMNDDRAYQFLGNFGSLGWIGVQFFFVLSGFVIARSTISGDWKVFFQKRALRILPTLWICTTVALFVRAIGSGEFLERSMDWARSVILSPKGPYIDGVIWTLTIEMIFYVLIAVVLLTCSNAKPIKSRLDEVAMILGSISTAFLLIRFLTTQIGTGLADVLTQYEWTVLLLNHGAMFASGMLLSSLDKSRWAYLKKSAITVFLAASLLQISLVAKTSEASIIAGTIFLVSVGLLVASVKYSAWLYSYTTWIPYAMLGRMSYPLYLCHFAVGLELTPLFRSVFVSPYLAFSMLLTLVMIYAWIVSEVLEPGLRSAFKNVLRID